ncbi:MAG: hypothetical protein ACR2H4_20295 [Pyrinomonadaceae bacterium]|jgi:hypothetical protein
METETLIRPLDVDGKIYAIQDEKRNITVTGTREVCEILLSLGTKSPSGTVTVIN